MFTHPYVLQRYAQERAEQLQREADDRRLADQAALLESTVLDSEAGLEMVGTPLRCSARLLAPLRLL